MSTSENSALIERWMANADSGFEIPISEFIHPNFIGHLQCKSFDYGALVQLESDFAIAFPNGHRQIEDLITDGNKVVVRITFKAKHQGDFQGISATQRAVSFSGITIYRVQESKIIESWGEVDFYSLWRQITL